MRVPSASLFIVGRIRGITRKRLAEICRQAGWSLASRPGPGVGRVGIGDGTARTLIAEGPRLALPPEIKPSAILLSESSLKLALGLSTPNTDDPPTLTEADLVRSSGLSAAEIQLLGLYDVVLPSGQRYRFQDLVVAREVRRLTTAGYDFASVVDAGVHLRRAGRSLADTRIGIDRDVALDEELVGRIGDANGQFRLKLRDRPLDDDEVFARAEAAEASGDLREAERCYRLLMKLDRTDPVIPFNLGNVLSASGRTTEAAIAYRDAIARDGAFAEGWLNLAVAAEERGRSSEAAELYDGALRSRPDFPEALFSAALFHSRAGNGATAIPLWNRFLATGPSDVDAALARRQLRSMQ